MNKQVRFTTALALGAALLSIPGLAIAQEVTLEIDDIEGRATLLARGVAANVLVAVTCENVPADRDTAVQVQLLQRGARGILTGFGSVTIDCSSTSQQTVEVLVFPSSFSGQPLPFKPGSVLAQASLFSCSPFECDSAVPRAEEIRLGK